MFIHKIIRVMISRSVGLLRSSRWPFLAKEKVFSLQATTNYVLGIYSGWGHSEAKEISCLIGLWVEVFQVIRIKNVDFGDLVNVGFAIEIDWKSRFYVHSALNFPTFANLALSLCAEFQLSLSGKFSPEIADVAVRSSPSWIQNGHNLTRLPWNIYS